jgi:small GTP-binding protein
MSNEARRAALKTVLLGQVRVGKGCILDRQLSGEFEDERPGTIGKAFTSTIVQTREGPVRLQFWDTAGQEQYLSLASMHYRNANIAMLVFDLTRRETPGALEQWAAEVKEGARATVMLLLVGNRCDLQGQRAVSLGEAAAFQERVGAAHYFETSAKTGEGVDVLFQFITTVKSDLSQPQITRAVALPDRNLQQNGGCCG